MLIVALVLAVIGLAALVTAVVTNNEMIAWVCIGASGLGVLLLVADAIRDRAQRRSAPIVAAETSEILEPAEPTEVIAPVETAVETTEVIEPVADDLAEEVANEDHPEELVHDEPDYDMPTDDEADFPQPAEEAAVHVVDEEYLAEEPGDEYATVVTYVDEPESAATEYRYVQSSDTDDVEGLVTETETDSAATDSDTEHRDR